MWQTINVIAVKTVINTFTSVLTACGIHTLYYDPTWCDVDIECKGEKDIRDILSVHVVCVCVYVCFLQGVRQCGEEPPPAAEHHRPDQTGSGSC